MRTALHAGLPYARVDLDYLLTQVRLDKDRHICVTRQAIRAADHMLVGRYFDYQQVAFHKTVAGLEEVLKKAIGHLVALKWLDGSRAVVLKRIEEDEWADFNDQYLLSLLSRLAHDTSASALDRDRANSVLRRRPPSLILCFEKVGLRDGTVDEYKMTRRHFEQTCQQWTTELGLEPGRLFAWGNRKSLTKVGAHVAPSAIADEDYEEEFAQAVCIYNPDDKSSTAIMELPNSLMSTLADQELFLIRIYALLPEGNTALRAALKERASKLLAILPKACWVASQGDAEGPPNSTDQAYSREGAAFSGY